MIKSITNKEYVSFLRGNQATRNQISINEKGEHFGYFDNEKLVGVISKNETKNTIRVKGFMVNAHHTNNGIGTKLLNYLLNDKKDMTAFSTIHSRKIFERAGFEVETINGNNIAFMKRKAKEKLEAKKLDDSIKNELNPFIVELSKVILMLDKEERKLSIEYINSQLKKIK